MNTVRSSSLLFLLALALLGAGCGKKTQTAKVERQDISEYVFASGVLEPENEYHLTAQSDGYLVALNIEEGDLVVAGQVLAVIDNPQNQITAGSNQRLLGIARDNVSSNAPALRQVEASIAAARQKVGQDSVQADRFRRLYGANSVSKLELENMELALVQSRANLQALEQQWASLKRQAEQQLVVQQSQSEVSRVAESYNTVKAILGGKIYERYKQLGDFVRRGEVIAVIGSPDTLHARLNLDESNIGKVRLGQVVKVRLNVDAVKTLEAKVTDIRPAFDVQSQSFFVEASFTDSLPFKVSGTQLEANILTGARENVLVIPKAFLGYRDIVRVERDGKEVQQQIETGFVSNEWVEARTGLKEGETIVADLVK